MMFLYMSEDTKLQDIDHHDKFFMGGFEMIDGQDRAMFVALRETWKNIIQG